MVWVGIRESFWLEETIKITKSNCEASTDRPSCLKEGTFKGRDSLYAGDSQKLHIPVLFCFGLVCSLAWIIIILTGAGLSRGKHVFGPRDLVHSSPADIYIYLKVPLVVLLGNF